MDDPYANRPLIDGHPDIERKHLDAFQSSVASRTDEEPRISRMLEYLERLLGSGRIQTALVLGCGPMPHPIEILLKRGIRAIGVEPVPSFVRAANDFLKSNVVMEGVAEKIALPEGSQDLVLFEAVLEHVDSPLLALEEIYRVLRPGGVVVLSTTNRLRFRISGYNAEYNIPFYNWFPALVRESYVLRHLHYRPSLANYTPRPAVHWFTFSELCKLGRTAGFAQFYSFVDLVRPDDPTVQRSLLRRLTIRLIRRSAWFRAVVLTQVGDCIIMYKRR